MLQIVMLNGDLQGNSFDLFEGLKIGNGPDCHVQPSGLFFKQNYFLVSSTSSGSLFLKSENKKALISSGEDLLTQIELIPGLILSLNDVGLSVQDAESTQVTSPTSQAESTLNLEKAFKSLSNHSSPAPTQISENIQLFSKDVSFEFVRGPLIQKTWELPWSPISFGKLSALYFFIDETVQTTQDFLFLEEKGKQLILSSSLAGSVTLNGGLITGATPVSNGDLIEFGETAFYITSK